MTTLLQVETYDPNAFFDAIVKHLNLKSDAALSRRLDVAPPVISRLRAKASPIGATLLLNIHEETGLEISELRRLMGDTRKYFCAVSNYLY